MACRRPEKGPARVHTCRHRSGDTQGAWTNGVRLRRHHPGLPSRNPEPRKRQLPAPSFCLWGHMRSCCLASRRAPPASVCPQVLSGGRPRAWHDSHHASASRTFQALKEEQKCGGGWVPVLELCPWKAERAGPRPQGWSAGSFPVQGTAPRTTGHVGGLSLRAGGQMKVAITHCYPDSLFWKLLERSVIMRKGKRKYHD